MQEESVCVCVYKYALAYGDYNSCNLRFDKINVA